MWTGVSRCWIFAGSYRSPRPRSIVMWPSADALWRPRSIAERDEHCRTGRALASWKWSTLAYKISPMHRESLKHGQGRQALAHDADAGGGNEPGTGGEATGGPRPRLLFRLS